MITYKLKFLKTHLMGHISKIYTHLKKKAVADQIIKVLIVRKKILKEIFLNY